MASIVFAEPRASGWLKDRRFDLGFICGLTVLALAAGLAVMLAPKMLVPILLADLWLLGYHHVISTYTRLCFDKESFKRYGFLVVGLPFVVAAASLLTVVAAGGLWIIVSIYFYWQWFHYTRQSWGIAQAYRRKGGELPPPTRLDIAMFYALPVAGVINRSAQAPETFLFMEIHMVPVTAEVATAALALAALLIAAWVGQTVQLYRRGVLPLAYLLYQVSHHTIFLVAYILLADITVGWLVVNVWHNAQYVLFVWLFNNRRFQAGPNRDARLLSTLSQDGRLIWYLGFCLLVSTALYLTIGNLLPMVMAVPVFIVYHIINFNHYIVDAIIWRSAHVKRALQPAA